MINHYPQLHASFLSELLFYAFGKCFFIIFSSEEKQASVFSDVESDLGNAKLS